MTTFLVIILVLVGPIGIAFLIYMLAHYFMNRYYCVGRLSFDQFLTLYSVAPDKWDWYSELDGWGCVRYTYYVTNEGYESTSFYLSIPDAIRFMIWEERNIKNDKSQSDKKEIEQTAESWMNDIRNYCKEHDVPMKENKK